MNTLWERPPGRDLQAHSRDLRKGRVSETGRAYLITTVTHSRQPVFVDLAAGRLLVATLRHLDDLALAHTLAYVVMPDHIHWLIKLGPRLSLSAVVGRMKSYSSRRIGTYLGQSGPLWQPGFHDHAVRGDEDLRELSRYIVANPMRAGLVSRAGDYPLWDSSWL